MKGKCECRGGFAASINERTPFYNGVLERPMVELKKITANNFQIEAQRVIEVQINRNWFAIISTK